MYVLSGKTVCRPAGDTRKLYVLHCLPVKSSDRQPVDGMYTVCSRGARFWTPRHSGLKMPPTSTSTPSCCTSCWAMAIAFEASPCASAKIVCSGWPLMPPDALAWLTARSVFTLSSAPSMADDVPVSLITPILIGEPVACWLAGDEDVPPHATATSAAAAAIARRLQVPLALSHMADFPPAPPSESALRLEAMLGAGPGAVQPGFPIEWIGPTDVISCVDLQL